MSRLETVRENWTDITDKLLRDKQLLAHFLRFSAGMYKQSFSKAALIYQQNPYATKVATLETWNKLGRLVNRSEHSIAVFGEDNRAKYFPNQRQAYFRSVETHRGYCGRAEQRYQQEIRRGLQEYSGNYRRYVGG